MKIKELFRNYYIIILCCLPQCFSVQQNKGWKSFLFLFPLRAQISGLIITSPISLVFLYPLHFLSFSFFSLKGTLTIFLLCLFRHRTLFFFPLLFCLPSLPLFSLAGSVCLPRDSPVLCSRYRPIDFGRERKYCGHDSSSMNLMIPVLSVTYFQ